jgi:hypothetical protein
VRKFLQTGIFGALLIGLVLTGSTPVHARSLPNIKATDLNKKAVNWPAGLPSDRTVLIIAFTRGQQSQVDGWVSGLKLKSSGGPAWFEVPLINNPGSIARYFIDNGMRSGIPGTEARSHVVTVYAKKAELMKQMGLVGEKTVHVLVVDRKGNILESVSGAYNDAGAAAVTKAAKS